MGIPVKRWAEALTKRQSTRTFTQNVLAKTETRKLAAVAEMMQGCCPAARAVVIDRAPQAIFQGIIGAYGSVQGAPACAVFIADQTHPHYQEMTGYLGEAVILEATALGLATCWVGGFFRSTVVKSLINMAANERIMAVTPLGYPAPKRWDEKLMKRIARSANRKSLADIGTPAPDSWPAWAQAGLAAAGVAPSAVNRQPWLFSYDDGIVTVKVVRGLEPGSVSRRLDCGIAMLHFMLGSTEAGATGHWEWRSGADVGVFRNTM
jgi:hypothetical protein